MTARLLDTNIVSYMVKSNSLCAVYRPHLDGYLHAISFQTLSELWAWAEFAGWGPVKRARLTAVLARMAVYHSDPVMCDRWVEVRVARRAQPIAVDDAWIAATALAYNLELVTHNPADFHSIPGLAVITEAP